MEQFLSKDQCGLCGGFSAQHWLFGMLEEWIRSIDQSNIFGMFLTKLLKAFDHFPHDLIIANLYAYGFSFFDTEIDEELKSKINNWYSSWKVILFGVQ